jgi:uncharacterized repeat protein (TIGR03803 family)
MKAELLPPTANVHTFAYATKLARKQWCACAMALGTMLLLVAVAPSAHGQILTVLHSFTGIGSDGMYPVAGLIRNTAGILYGTTQYGGSGSCFGVPACGTVFKVDSTGKETTIYSFLGGTDASHPEGNLIFDAAGNLYGTTRDAEYTSCGTLPGCGTVFKLDATGKDSLLHIFTGSPDGRDPFFSGLFRGAKGNLYGTTYNGGNSNCTNGCGTVVKLDASGNQTVLYRFTGGADGANPASGVIGDGAGNLYGTTHNGGNLNCGVVIGCGTIFKLDKTGKETVLYTFTGGADGCCSYAGLIRDAAGNFYGTTGATVFKLDKTGKLTVLYTFTGGVDGGTSFASVIRDAAGNLYGTTYFGGSYNHGTVFKLDTTGKESVLHSFTGGPDGSNPDSNLVMDAAGNLYGTTYNGGDIGCDCGVVFKIAP